ncbi:PKD domain-containing protein [Umboniibacter marinipuniceus]|uniref:PKD domain-containing protein n=1 Tax=Umboniibacter marinipuniceus TaxID=569599 RepID=A0A3M0AUM7_9GAMM|nr:PKD domain-containing protein [Umboniibacter marinipuniceus]RMA82662.1 PKD domain-containing protein [Umboniibacter marinipuniceus]
MRILAISLALLLAACSNDSPNQPDNPGGGITPPVGVPVADAGQSILLQRGATATLNGSGSYDPDGDSLTYQWTVVSQPSSSSSVLSDENSVFPSIYLDAVGDYVIELVVNDGEQDSAPSQVTISDTDTMPVALAGPDRSVAVGQPAALNGASSFDVDGDALSFSWTIASAPSGSSATLSRSDSPYPMLTPDVEGDYVIELVVSDGFLDSNSDEVVVSTANVAPIANAGIDQSYVVGQAVILDGSASSDANGDPLSFKWHIVSAPSGSSAVLANADQGRASITPDITGPYVIGLVVNDGTADSRQSNIALHSGNQAPVANAGRDLTGTIGQIVHLDGSASSDPNGDPLSFQWSFTSKPRNSSAVLSDIHTVHPTFTPDLSGDYVIQLVASDGTANSVPTSITVSTNNTAPVANAGKSKSVATGSLYNLDGSASSDAEGAQLSYQWTILSLPSGSSVQLSDADIVSPSFTPDAAGDYVFQLVVNDGLLDSAPATVIMSDGDLPPVASAGPDQSAATGTAVTLDGSLSSDPENQTLNFMWSLISSPAGSGAVISNERSAVAGIVPDLAGDFVIQLKVSDESGQSDFDIIVIRDPATNTLPVANAGRDSTTLLGDQFILDGTASSDADGDSLFYSWSMLSRPSGSTAVLNNPQTPYPDFTPDVEGDFVIQLVVSDGKSTSFPDVVVIHDDKKNLEPTAIIAVTPDGTTGQSYQFDGSQSSDPEGEALSYNWTLLFSNGEALIDPTTAQPSFTPTKAGQYLIALSVSDGVNQSSTVSRFVEVKDPVKGAAIPTPGTHNLMMLSSRGGDSGVGSLISVPESNLTQPTEIMSFHGLPVAALTDPLQGWTVHPITNKAYLTLSLGGENDVGNIIEFEPSTQTATRFMTLPYIMHEGYKVREIGSRLLFHPDGKSAYLYSTRGGKTNVGVLLHVNFDSASADYQKVTVIADFGLASANFPGYTNAPSTDLYWNGDQIALIVGNTFSRSEKRHVLKIVPSDPQDLTKSWNIEEFGNTIEVAGRKMYVERDTQVIVDVQPGLVQNAPNGANGFRLLDCKNPIGTFLWESPEVFLLCNGAGSNYDPALFASNTSAVKPSQAATFGSLAGNEFKGLAVSTTRSSAYLTISDSLAKNFIFSTATSFLKAPTLSEMTKPNFSIRPLVTGGPDLGYYFFGDPAVVNSVNDAINDRYIVTFSIDEGLNGNGNIITYDRETSNTLTIPMGYPRGALPYGRILKSAAGDYFFPVREHSDGPGSGAVTARIIRYDSTTGDTENSLISRRAKPGLSMAETASGSIYLLSSDQTGVTTITTDLYELDPNSMTSTFITSYSALNHEAPDTELRLDNNNLWFFVDDTLYCRDLSSNTDGSLVLASSAANDPVYAVTFPTAGGDGFFATRADGAANQGTIQRLSNNCAMPTISGSVAGLTDLPSTALIAASDGNMYFGTEGGKLMRYNESTNSVAEVATVPNRSMVGFIAEDANGDLVGFASNGRSLDDQTYAYNLGTGAIVISDVPDDTPIDSLYPGFTEIN